MNYYVITEDMLRYGFSSEELIVYAIVNCSQQDSRTKYDGGLEYISRMSGLTKQEIKEALQSINTKLKSYNMPQYDLLQAIDTSSKDKKTTFKDSEVYSLIVRNNVIDSKMLQEFVGRYDDVDLDFYLAKVFDWSEQNAEVHRTNSGWIATIRAFIRKDEQWGTLQVRESKRAKKITTDEAIDYLNM